MEALTIRERGARAQFHVVLHLGSTQNHGEVFDAAEVLYACGADGVMLADHESAYTLGELFMLACYIKSRVPKLHVGFNPALSLKRVFADGGLELLARLANKAENSALRLPDAIWIDEQIHPSQVGHYTEFSRVLFEHNMSLYSGLAFKYQQHIPVESYPEYANAAKGVVSGLVTSGTEAGVPADAGLVSAAAQAAHSVNLPLVLAGGVTDGNIREYPDVDMFFIGTYFKKSGGGVDDGKILEMRSILEEMV